LIAREIMCDYRPNAGIRLSPHFYNTEAECDHAVETLAELVGKKR
jgi:kynureninase